MALPRSSPVPQEASVIAAAKRRKRSRTGGDQGVTKKKMEIAKEVPGSAPDAEIKADELPATISISSPAEDVAVSTAAMVASGRHGGRICSRGSRESVEGLREKVDAADSASNQAEGIVVLSASTSVESEKEAASTACNIVVNKEVKKVGMTSASNHIVKAQNNLVPDFTATNEKETTTEEVVDIDSAAAEHAEVTPSTSSIPETYVPRSPVH